MSASTMIEWTRRFSTDARKASGNSQLSVRAMEPPAELRSKSRLEQEASKDGASHPITVSSRRMP